MNILAYTSKIPVLTTTGDIIPIDSDFAIINGNVYVRLSNDKPDSMHQPIGSSPEFNVKIFDNESNFKRVY